MPQHYVIVDGIALPARLAGQPVLEFCNTLAGWDDEVRHDYLQSYDHLAVWAGFMDLLAPDHVAALRRAGAADPAAACAALEQARQQRAGIYELLAVAGDGSAFERVAEDVHAAAAAMRLQRTKDGVEWRVDRAAGLAAPLVAVGWSTGQLLSSPDLAHVRVCPGHGCGWLFLDPRGRRRWCTMAICGNRAKVNRFAQRERAVTREQQRRASAARATDRRRG